MNLVKEKPYKTFLCCGKYHLVLDNAKRCKITCASCGRELKVPLPEPQTIIIHK